MPDRFDTAAVRLISTLQELNFPMPAIEGEIDTPLEEKWTHTIASILREHLGHDTSDTETDSA